MSEVFCSFFIGSFSFHEPYPFLKMDGVDDCIVDALLYASKLKLTLSMVFLAFFCVFFLLASFVHF
ncbi:MAG TPA: hypothetical protein DCL40_02080 [Coxiellaceae bacterium]|nr:hypothetical protein [Coxiellaceae bacterium]